MHTSSEITQRVAELRSRKASVRATMRNMTPTQKIIQLEALQERFYELLEIRRQNFGRPIPDEWQRWKRAQRLQDIEK